MNLIINDARYDIFGNQIHIGDTVAVQGQYGLLIGTVVDFTKLLVRVEFDPVKYNNQLTYSQRKGTKKGLPPTILARSDHLVKRVNNPQTVDVQWVS